MTALEFNNKLISMEGNLERFARRLTYSKEAAKDLMQDTYLKALSSRDTFIEFTNFKAWTYTIMKNTFINNYRKSVREKNTLEKTENLFLFNSSKESKFARPDSEFACKEINKAIDVLKDELKIPFRMHTEGYKYTEIAETLNLNIGTVKSRIFLTRKKLMETLHEYK
jgi:RNA polymerase sigma factor (sigma-70 family)